MTAETDSFAFERRLRTRYKAATQVRLKTKDGRSKLCRLVNLSSDGCCVYTGDFGLRRNEEIELVFAIKTQGNITKTHRRNGVVCYVKDGNTGFSMRLPNDNWFAAK